MFKTQNFRKCSNVSEAANKVQKGLYSICQKTWYSWLIVFFAISAEFQPFNGGNDIESKDFEESSISTNKPGIFFDSTQYMES